MTARSEIVWCADGCILCNSKLEHLLTGAMCKKDKPYTKKIRYIFHVHALRHRRSSINENNNDNIANATDKTKKLTNRRGVSRHGTINGNEWEQFITSITFLNYSTKAK